MNPKDIIDWSEEDISQWMKDLDFPSDLIDSTRSHHVTGKTLLTKSDEYICQQIYFHTELKLKVRIMTEIYQLRMENKWRQRTATKQMAKIKDSKCNNAPVSIAEKREDSHTKMDEINANEMKVKNKKQNVNRRKKLHPDITLRRKYLQSNHSQISTNSKLNADQNDTNSLCTRIPKQIITTSVSDDHQSNVIYSKVSVIQSETDIAGRGRKRRHTRRPRGRNRNRDMRQRNNGRKQQGLLTNNFIVL